MRTFQWLSIVSVVVAMAVNYISAAFDGRWPAGHPWSGLSMSCIAVSLFSTVRHPDRPPHIVIVGLLALFASIAWMLAEIGA